MPKAETAKFEEFVLEIEFETGTYERICGVSGVGVNRTNNTETSSVPDCADESLPDHIVRMVASQDATISGTGVWALEHDAKMKTWFFEGSTRNVRITNAKVVADGVAGDIEAETYPMIMSQMNNERTKGQVVSAEVTFEKAGAVTLTEKA